MTVVRPLLLRVPCANICVGRPSTLFWKEGHDPWVELLETDPAAPGARRANIERMPEQDSAKQFIAAGNGRCLRRG